MTDDHKYYLEVTHDELGVIHGGVLGAALGLAAAASHEETLALAVTTMLNARRLGQDGITALLDKIKALHETMHPEKPNVDLQGTTGLH